MKIGEELEPETPRMGRKVVLVIDDDAVDREAVRRHIEPAFDVVEASDGAAGLALFRDRRPDCVLLDYRLPDVDGLELLAGIQELNADAAVVLLTGEGNESVAVEAMKRGAQDYLIKGHLTSLSLRRAIENAQLASAMKRTVRAQRTELRDFAFTAAHDLRAPLRRLKAWFEILESGGGDEGQEPFDREHVTARIAVSLDAMSDLIDHLLAYADAGASRAAFEEVSLESTLDGVLVLLENTIRERGAEIERSPLPVVWGDPTALTLVLQNLVGNALKYHEGSPRISIRATRMEPEWIVEVQDDGIGIAPADAERIFEPFERLHGRDRYEGSGIGLATCRRIIEAHGGTIRAVPASDGGSVFRFSLPVDAALTRPALDDEPSRSAAGRPSAAPILARESVSDR